MKTRSPRITIVTGAVGLLVVAGLVTVKRSVVKDHVAAWHFAFTTETRAIEPQFMDRTQIRGTTGLFPTKRVFQYLADYSDLSVVFDPLSVHKVRLDSNRLTADFVIATLHENGFRLVEQRFPRPAYVVVGYPRAELTCIPQSMPRPRATRPKLREDRP